MVLGFGNKKKQKIELEELYKLRKENEELILNVESLKSEADLLKKKIQSKDSQLEVLKLRLSDEIGKPTEFFAELEVDGTSDAIQSGADAVAKKQINLSERIEKKQFKRIEYTAQVRRVAVKLITECCTLTELENCLVDSRINLPVEQCRAKAVEIVKKLIQNYAPSIARKSGYRGDKFDFANTLSEDGWAIRQMLDKEVVKALKKLEIEGHEKVAQQVIWNDFKAILQNKLDEHKVVLSRNIRKSYQKNEYGSTVRDDRNDEIERFLKSAKLLQQSKKIKERKKIYDFVKRWYNKNRNEFEITATPPTDGHDYEVWVAAKLRQFGWTAEVTQGSGDQGVDVIASIEELSVAIQCKRYSGSVGNKAVQEVMAGMMHYGLDHAVIISTGKYTKSATDLAETGKVHLLTHNDIPLLRNIVFKNSK